MSFVVSVIIPVYNLEKYIAKAIESVLNQKHVGEILIVDDGSTDNTWAIANEYSDRFPEIVKVITHNGHANKGLGATRNTGIKEAKYDFISFLDGDDYYLPDRFVQTKVAFEENENADGVYEVLGTEFRNSVGKELFSQVVAQGRELNDDYVTRVRGNVQPEKLFEVLARKTHGCFTCETLTVRKNLFKKAGFFKENLRLHGDNEAFLRFAYYGVLIPSGKDEPVAIRVVHETNRMTTERDRLKRHLFNKAVFDSFYDKAITAEIKRIFFKEYLFGHIYRIKGNIIAKHLTTGLLLILLLLRYPKMTRLLLRK